MNPAPFIAQRLFESGIRMATIEDHSMVLSAPDYLHMELARLYLRNRKVPAEVVVRSDQEQQLGADQAYFQAGWLVLIDDPDFLLDVDAELWALQQQYVAEAKAEARGALLRDQAA